MPFDDVIAANKEYAATFDRAGLKAQAARHLAVLTCIDSRIDPLGMLGLRAGDAKILRNAGAHVSYHDPHVARFDGLTSVDLEPEAYDSVVIVTAHSSIDYADVVRRGNVIVDFRNATGSLGSSDGKVVKL